MYYLFRLTGNYMVMESERKVREKMSRFSEQICIQKCPLAVRTSSSESIDGIVFEQCAIAYVANLKQFIHNFLNSMFE